MIEASAPGKLLLTGEYAVLDGAPAVSMAVDVRAVVQVRTAAHSELLDGDQAYPFVLDPGGTLTWTAADPAERGSLLAALTTELCRGKLPPLSIRMDSSGFLRSIGGGPAAKLGLGSSAAVMTALAGALLRAVDQPLQPESIAAACLAAHRRFQGGRGSGADLLTALHGGIVGIIAGEHGPVAEPLRWPEGLQWIPVWSGTPASTPAMIARFDAFRRRRPVVYRQHLASLQEAAEAALDAWRQGSTPAVMATARAFAAHLRRLDQDAGIGIYSAAHQAIDAICLRAGAVYKTSGAGGGDFGFALTSDVAVVSRLRSDLAAAGWQALELARSDSGLQVAGAGL